MVMSAAVLQPLMKQAILDQFAALSWGVAEGAPSAGTEAGNANVAPTKIQDDLAEAISQAVANTVLTHITTFALVTGIDTAGDTHVTPPVIT